MSGITAKEDISILREDVPESRQLAKTIKTLVFKHEATAGQTLIDLNNLTAPTSALANGFPQPTAGELSAANLMANKKNFRLKSSRGVELEQYEDFIITGNMRVQLIGNIADLGGALAGEIFTGYISPVVTNAYPTTDAQLKKKTYTLPAGQTVLNLGLTYKVGVGLTTGEQVGALDVILDGVEQFRNVGNAAASPSADGNYQEVDAGNGTGTTIQFNVAAAYDRTVIVKFGVVAAGDYSLISDMEAMMGSLMQVAQDAATEFDYPLSRYLTANPSAAERRAFGDAVLALLTRVTALESSPTPQLFAVSPTNPSSNLVAYGTVLKQTGITYDPLTGLVTVITPGIYTVSGGAHNVGNALGGQFGLSLEFAGTTRFQQYERYAADGGMCVVSGSWPLLAGETLRIRWINGGGGIDGGVNHSLSVVRTGNL